MMESIRRSADTVGGIALTAKANRLNDNREHKQRSGIVWHYFKEETSRQDYCHGRSQLDCCLACSRSFSRQFISAWAKQGELIRILYSLRNEFGISRLRNEITR